MSKHYDDNDIHYLLSTEEKTLVYLSSPTCFPCKVFKKSVDKACTDLNIKITEVDATENIPLCKKLGVKSVPTIVLVEDKGILDIHTGLMTESALKSFLT